MLAILHPALLFRERDHAPPHCGAAFTPSGMGEAGVVGGSLYSQLTAMHAEPTVRIRLPPAQSQVRTSPRFGTNLWNLKLVTNHIGLAVLGVGAILEIVGFVGPVIWTGINRSHSK
jgi:hypothetical protein